MSKSYFWKRALLCVYIFEPQIYILLFNKLVSYKVLISYMNLQVGFFGSNVEQRLELLPMIPYLSTLEPSTPSFIGKTC